MTTISWHTDVLIVSHSGHLDTIREGQMMVMTKQKFNCRSLSL